MRLERETAGSFVMWRGAAGMVCTVHDALIPLFNLSARPSQELVKIPFSLKRPGPLRMRNHVGEERPSREPVPA